MELDLQTLLNKLQDNPQEILGKIHNDPLLVKRQCPINPELYVANASKQLFTPNAEHQLFAKGIIYSLIDGVYKLASLPLIKIYNIGENQTVNTHVNRMINKEKCQIYMLPKADGTNVNRWVYKDKVYFSTRGMIETMIVDGTDNSQFFKWTRDIVAKKYPELLDSSRHKNSTISLELVGPENQIVTKYNEWDLKLISITRHGTDYYYLGQMATTCLNALGGVLKPMDFEGTTLDEKIANLNEHFKGKDDEGCVIQFEKSGVILGRVKAKTDTYRSLLKVINNCNYDSVAELIKKSGVKSWDTFENYLRSLGNDTVPEELIESYKDHYYDFENHQARLRRIFEKVKHTSSLLIDKYKISFWCDADSVNVGKEGKKILAEKITKNIDQKLHHFLFASLNNKLTTDYVSDRVKKPEESDEILTILNNITYQNI